MIDTVSDRAARRAAGAGWLGALFAISVLAGCSWAKPPVPAGAGGHSPDCTAPEKIGQFDPASDLLVANFDSKTDTDDFHSVAALATMLADPRLACVRYIAVAGAYGRQGGKFLPAPELFDLAFGSRWTDADADRENAASVVTALMLEAVRSNGHVWVQEAGQSDFTAMVVRRLEDAGLGSDIHSRITVVQHSEWNEKSTDPDALAYVRSRTNYVKIPDGNAVGNGSPGFVTREGSLWQAALSLPQAGPVWAEARRQASGKNGQDGGYYNRAIAAGGFDFSDASEVAWIFGYSHLRDPDDFFRMFGTHNRQCPQSVGEFQERCRASFSSGSNHGVTTGAADDVASEEWIPASTVSDQ